MSVLQYLACALSNIVADNACFHAVWFGFSSSRLISSSVPSSMSPSWYLSYRIHPSDQIRRYTRCGFNLSFCDLGMILFLNRRLGLFFPLFSSLFFSPGVMLSTPLILLILLLSLIILLLLTNSGGG
jgi:hypothetical protein